MNLGTSSKTNIMINTPTYTFQNEKEIKTVKGKHRNACHHHVYIKFDKYKIRRKRDPIKLLDDPLDIITKKLDKKKDSSHSNRKEKKKSSSSTSSTTIEKLRLKRLEREKSEKIRVKQLYLGPNEELQEQEETDDRKRGYNSQFNRLETVEAKKRRRYH